MPRLDTSDKLARKIQVMPLKKGCRIFCVSHLPCLHPGSSLYNHTNTKKLVKNHSEFSKNNTRQSLKYSTRFATLTYHLGRANHHAKAANHNHYQPCHFARVSFPAFRPATRPSLFAWSGGGRPSPSNPENYSPACNDGRRRGEGGGRRESMGGGERRGRGEVSCEVHSQAKHYYDSCARMCGITHISQTS